LQHVAPPSLPVFVPQRLFGRLPTKVVAFLCGITPYLHGVVSSLVELCAIAIEACSR